MISTLVSFFVRSLAYVRQHPQLVFVLVLILVLPMLFLWSGQRFLEVGRMNQERLQADRVGMLHDAFISVLYASDFSSSTAQVEIDRLVLQNPDVTEFAITRLESGNLTVLAAADRTLAGSAAQYDQYYRASAVNSSESLIFPVTLEGERVWLSYRAVERIPGEFYFIYTSFSLAAIDSAFASREQGALFALMYIYVFLLALAYWHIRMTDYRYLYQKAANTIAMKDQFTNMMAHELRAPLTAMRGYASLIVEDAESTPAAKGYGEKIGDASERLLTIVNDLLDVSRLQSGKISVKTEPVAVETVVRAVVDELRVSAEAKGITLSVSAPAETLIIIGDETRLHQAVTNLVSNAIKYTPKGSIELALASLYSKVEIRVKDTGTGISFEDQQKLFAPFFRVNSESVEKITGSGLGMWITKQLIELMGGTVAVESIKGVGTHLVVQLPKQPKVPAGSQR